VIKLEQLEVLMGIYSKRDLPEVTKEAVRLRVVNDGHIYEMVELITGVTRKTIAQAVRKLENPTPRSEQCMGFR